MCSFMMYNVLLLTAMLAARPASSARPPTQSEAELLQVEVTSRHMQRRGSSNQGVDNKQDVEKAFQHGNKALGEELKDGNPAGVAADKPPGAAAQQASTAQDEHDDFEDHQPKAEEDATNLKALNAELETLKGAKAAALKEQEQEQVAHQKALAANIQRETETKATQATKSKEELDVLAAAHKKEEDDNAAKARDTQTKVAEAQAVLNEKMAKFEEAKVKALASSQKLFGDDDALVSKLQGLMDGVKQKHTEAAEASKLAQKQLEAAQAASAETTKQVVQLKEQAEAAKTASEASFAAEKAKAQTTFTEAEKAAQTQLTAEEARLATAKQQAEATYQAANTENEKLAQEATTAQAKAKTDEEAAKEAAAQALQAEEQASEHLKTITAKIEAHAVLREGIGLEDMAAEGKDHYNNDGKDCTAQDQNIESRPQCDLNADVGGISPCRNFSKCVRCAKSSGHCTDQAA